MWQSARNHGIKLDSDWENAVAIWNIGGLAGFDRGRQDLMVTNGLAVPITLAAVSEGERVTIQAYVGT